MDRFEDSIIFGLTFIAFYFIIEQIDARYILPRMIRSAKQMEIVCDDIPEKCWFHEKQRSQNG